MIHLKSQQEIEILRESNLIVHEVLTTLKSMCQPGITTLELDRVAEDMTRKHQGRPAFKGYHGFPATLCTSINEEVVHGIPSKRTLREGTFSASITESVIATTTADAAVTVPLARSRKIWDSFSRQRRNASCWELNKPCREIIWRTSQQDSNTRRSSRIFNRQRFLGMVVGELAEDGRLNMWQMDVALQLKPGLVLAIEPMVNQGTDKVIVLRMVGRCYEDKSARPTSSTVCDYR